MVQRFVADAAYADRVGDFLGRLNQIDRIKETNLKVSAKNPATYLAAYAEKDPALLSSHWIPLEPELWIRQTPTGPSICQVGTVQGRDGVVVDRWKTLVNPEDWVDPWNVSVHVIAENQSATDRCIMK